jgi:peptidoglycan/LPS O-acetylase OafA/YrhL
MRRIVELDGVRAVAILGVIGRHYFPLSTMLFKIPEFGWSGVELFFVLSGFLITSILLQLKNRPRAYEIFYVRRILRIFPPYYAVMAIVMLIALTRHDDVKWSRIAVKAAFLQSFSNEGRILTHVALTVGGALPIADPFTEAPLPRAIDRLSSPNFINSLGPTWSLSVEEWFYILWAPLVLSATRRQSD